MDINGQKLAMLGWEQELARGLVKSSFWEQTSNRWDGSASTFNESSKNSAPSDVFHRLKTNVSEDKWCVTQAMIAPFSGTFVGGEQQAKGKESTTQAWSMTCYYNVWRYSYKFRNASGVSSNASKWLIKAKNGVEFAKEYAAKLRDYFAHAALVDGAIPILTDDQYWQDHEITSMQSAPVAKRLHPRIVYKGQTAAITRSAIYATDVDNVVAALKSMAPTSVFDSAAAMKMVQVLRSTCRPLKGYNVAGKAVDYIVLLTEFQAMDLASDATWKSDVLNGDERGANNRAISGVMGVRWGVLFLSNARGPVFALETSGALVKGPMYLKPDTSTDATTDAGYLFGTEQIPRKVKGAATVATGTCELAIGLGAGAIVAPLVRDITFESEKDDFNFRESFCMMAMEGGQRGEFTKPDGTVVNFSSIIYATATPNVAV